MLWYAKSDSDLCIVLTGKFILHSPNTQQHDNNLKKNPKNVKISKINKRWKQTNTLEALSDRRSSLAVQRPQPSLIANQRILERVERWDVERAAKETAATQECVRGLVLLN